MKHARDIELYDGLFVRWMAKLEADLPMILEIAKQTGGPILELACGSGRLMAKHRALMKIFKGSRLWDVPVNF